MCVQWLERDHLLQEIQYSVFASSFVFTIFCQTCFYHLSLCFPMISDSEDESGSKNRGAEKSRWYVFMIHVPFIV